MRAAELAVTAELAVRSSLKHRSKERNLASEIFADR